jgi:hypothetical protein
LSQTASPDLLPYFSQRKHLSENYDFCPSGFSPRVFRFKFVRKGQLKVDVLRLVHWFLRMEYRARKEWERVETDDYEIVFVLEGPDGDEHLFEESEAVRMRVEESGWTVKDFKAVSGEVPIRNAYINSEA